MTAVAVDRRVRACARRCGGGLRRRPRAHASASSRSTGSAPATRSTTSTDSRRRADGVDARTFAGATLFGLAMFGTLFLGIVLAIFLTLGAVRGDAERGLLQPLVVRPLGRATLLLARFLGAAAVCVAYVLARLLRRRC